MTLQEFIDRFDVPNSIVLLEGKRAVLSEDSDMLIAVGKTLAEKSKFINFRSGNASGADEYFSLGVCAVNPKRLEVVIPYSGHRKRKNASYNTISLDNLSLASEPEVVYQSRANKKTEKLIDQYLLGKRDRFAIKAAYILRDTIKVIGATDIPPASFGLFYDDLLNPMQGGTKHTMKTCKNNDVPFIDQRTWFQWIS